MQNEPSLKISEIYSVMIRIDRDLKELQAKIESLLEDREYYLSLKHAIQKEIEKLLEKKSSLLNLEAKFTKPSWEKIESILDIQSPGARQESNPKENTIYRY